jgi:hypothetical protein
VAPRPSARQLVCVAAESSFRIVHFADTIQPITSTTSEDYRAVAEASTVLGFIFALATASTGHQKLCCSQW